MRRLFLPLGIVAAIVLVFVMIGFIVASSDAAPGGVRGKPTKTPTVTSTTTGPIDNTCATDVTADLNSYIASVPNGTTLNFSGCYLVDGTIEFRGRTLYFNGGTFVSKKTMVPGTYADDQRAMFRAVESTVRFTNMTLDGAYTAGGTLDESLQHAHAIDLRGSNANVSGVSITDFAGDCVYFGLGYNGTSKSTGSFHDSTCKKTGRNGVSLTASSGVQVYTNAFDTIGFITVDVEPNIGPGWGTDNTSITNNTIGTYRLYALGVIENAPNNGVVFTGNKVTGSKGLRIGVISLGTLVRAKSVTIQNNTAVSAQAPPAIEANNVDGLTVTGNTIPMSGGTMAIVSNSTQVNVSGNQFPGGTREVEIR